MFTTTAEIPRAYGIVNGRPAKVAGKIIGRALVNYVGCTTLGLVGAFGCSVYTLWDLVCCYGESAASAFAFVLLAIMAGMAFLGTYLVTFYFTAVGSLVWLAKWLKRQRECRALRDESERARTLTEIDDETAPELEEDEHGSPVGHHLHEE